MISSESRKLLLPNLVWWCIIMSQIVFQEDWFAVFEAKVTVKDNIIKRWLSNMSSELLILLQLNLVWWHIILSLWKKLDWSVVVKVKVTEKVQNSSDCSSGQYLINCWTFCNQTQIRPRQYLGASESPHSVQIRPRRHLNAWESPPSVQIRPGRYLGAWQSQNSVQIRPRRYLGTWENPHSVQIIRRR